MSGGEWLIRQAPRTALQPGLHVERITIETDTAGGPDPQVSFKVDSVMVFMYADGREIVFPWANIIRAEYRPHPEP